MKRSANPSPLLKKLIAWREKNWGKEFEKNPRGGGCKWKIRKSKKKGKMKRSGKKLDRRFGKINLFVNPPLNPPLPKAGYAPAQQPVNIPLRRVLWGKITLQVL